MRIELRGIVQFADLGKRYVDVVVIEGNPHKYKKHRVGVDIKVNRGTIINFLSGTYGVPPGEIDWPEHIVAEDKG